jgi:AraC-type DNA-binding domain-containing proteins
MDHGLSVALVHPILGYLVKKGYELDSFFQYASFDKLLLQDIEARIREETFDRLLDAASAYTNDKQFGLHLGQTIELSSLGILGYVLLNSDTIGAALAAYQRYNIIVCSGIDIEWESAQGRTNLLLNIRDPLRQASRHAVEGMVSSLYHLTLKLSCRNVALHRVQFAHGAPDDQREYEDLLGIQPEFAAGVNLITLDNEVLQYPILISNRELRSTFEAYAEEARSELLHGRTWADQVYKWINRCMPATFPSVEAAARNLNVSVRTMQINLKQENTTYSSLFNKARMELAVHYLRDPRFTVAEIAYLLQFSEPSAFQSAFKKWSGQPPGQYREALQTARGTIP